MSASNLVAEGSCDAEFTGDPMLGDLVEPEDGSPAYYSLLPGSPAIDAASSDHCPDARTKSARPAPKAQPATSARLSLCQSNSGTNNCASHLRPRPLR